LSYLIQQELNEALPCIGKDMLDDVSTEDENTVEIIGDVLGIAFGGREHWISSRESINSQYASWG